MAAIPRETYKKWVIEALRTLGATTPTMVYQWILEQKTIPSGDINDLTPDGKDVIYKKEIRWARLELRMNGVIKDGARGLWELAAEHKPT